MKVMALKICYMLFIFLAASQSYHIAYSQRTETNLFSKLNNAMCLVGPFQIWISKMFFNKPDFVKIVKP